MSAYIDAVMADGPVYFYPLTETSGSEVAQVGSSAAGPGTNVGGNLDVMFAAQAAGWQGDRVDDRLRFWSQSGVFGSAFTIETWAETRESPIGSPPMIAACLELGDGGQYLGGLWLYTSGWYLAWQVGQTTMREAYSFQWSLPTSTKFHVVAAVSGASARLYLNGVYQGGNEGEYSFGNSPQFGVRAEYPSYEGLRGPLAFYSYQLSASRVAAHYQAGITEPEPEPDPDPDPDPGDPDPGDPDPDPVPPATGGRVDLDLELADPIVEPDDPDPYPPEGGVLAVCEVWRLGTRVGSPKILGGSVVEDVKARTFRTADLSLATAAPSTLRCLLAPGGTELRVWRWERRNGEGGWTLLGRFYYRDASVERTRLGVDVSCHDASMLIRENRWTEPYAVTRGISHPEAVAVAVRDRLNEYTWAGATWIRTSARTRSWTWGEDVEHDPWQTARDLPRALGWDMWIGRDGVLRMEPVAELDAMAIERRWVAGDPVLGRDYLDASRQVVGRGYNGVRARTEVPEFEAEDAEPTPIFTALVWDDDPDSLSFEGLYRRPRFLTSSLFTNQGQVEDAARAELARNVGMFEDVTIEVVSDSALRPRMGVWVTDPKIRADGPFVVDAVTTPVLGGPSRLTLRRRRVPE